MKLIAYIYLCSFIFLFSCVHVEPEPSNAPTSSLSQTEIAVEPRISVMDSFARITLTNGAVYMVLMNAGGQDDALLSVESNIAQVVELHESKVDNHGVVRMASVEQVTIPAGGSTTLKPGGLHVMLISVQSGLALGDTFDITLNFEKSEPQSLTIEITEGLAKDYSHLNHGNDEERYDNHDEDKRK